MKPSIDMRLGATASNRAEVDALPAKSGSTLAPPKADNASVKGPRAEYEEAYATGLASCESTPVARESLSLAQR